MNNASDDYITPFLLHESTRYKNVTAHCSTFVPGARYDAYRYRDSLKRYKNV